MKVNELNNGLYLGAHYLDHAQQIFLLEDIRKVLSSAPLFRALMPRSGRPFSVLMSNCGTLGWVSDKAGYRYQATHPVTRQAWPAMPASLMRIWQEMSGYGAEAECCLINFYNSEAKLGLHRDNDEEEHEAPIISISLGDTALFRFGGPQRKGPTSSVRLNSGDIVIMGGTSRLNYHGIDRIYPETSPLLKEGGRLNLTLRRVSKKPLKK